MAARAEPPRARLDVEERRRQLVALGIELFSQRPYDEVSIEELAQEAGISKGLLYHYFPTKRHFYIETVREAARQLLEKTATAGDMDPLDRLRRGLDAYIDYVAKHGKPYEALLRSGVGADAEVRSARVSWKRRRMMRGGRWFAWRCAGGWPSSSRRRWSGWTRRRRSTARRCATC